VTAQRICIVTINDDANYGNRLQNYALQEMIRAQGGIPETLRGAPARWDRALHLPRLAWEITDDPAGLARRGTDRIRRRTGRAPSPPAFLGRRRQAIAGFTAAYIDLSSETLVTMSPSMVSSRYARAVAGSDQIWNPVYRRASSADFLQFVEPSRRSSYAASFGVPRIPRFLQARYAEWLRSIPHLSVREPAGARIVQQLTGRQAPVVLDPTLLVDRPFWDTRIAGIPPLIDRPYAVQFFLGRATSAQRGLARGIAQERGLEIVDLNDLEHEAFAHIGPLEFVAAIAGAGLVLTDSFHAAAFSLIYRRSLVLRERHANDERVTSLLSSHALRRTEIALGLSSPHAVDWPRAEAARHERRVESTAFLRAALGVESS
jgi:hypothetical protein